MELDNINIVMVETTHPGNIGAAARAMKNMGLSRLRLVNPQCSIDGNAYARASGADEVLNQRVDYPSLTEAVADCSLVVGTSARTRTLVWPALTPAELGQRAVQASVEGAVAIVFGREHSGLTNDELQHCHYSVTIPTNPSFSSLNVAASIQIIGYEIFQHWQQGHAQEPPSRSRSESRADSGELEGFFQHLERVLVDIDFLDAGNPRQIMKRFRRLYQRAEPSRNEVNILRGMLSAVQKIKGAD